MAGKGSRPRPLSVPRKVYEDNYDRIFRKPKGKPVGQREDKRNKRK